MRIYKVTANYDDGNDSWEDNLGVFRFRSVAEKVKKDFENVKYSLANQEEPDEPNYDSSLLSLSDFYRSNEYMQYSKKMEEWRNACWLQDVSIATWIVDGRRV